MRSKTGAVDQILVNFVLGINGANDADAAEKARFSDIIFVRENSQLNSFASRLQKHVQWFECALVAWPAAMMVGKADDDAWVNLPAVSHSLRMVLDALPPSAASHLYWGSFETYHWHTGNHGAGGFWKHPMGALHLRWDNEHRGMCRECALLNHGDINAGPYGTVRSKQGDACRNSSSITFSKHGGPSLIGPFSFAKGPFYLLSSPLASEVFADPQVKREAAAAIAASGQYVDQYVFGARRGGWPPFEDAFMGMAIAVAGAPKYAQILPTLVHVSPIADFIDAGSHGSAPGHFHIAPTTLVWHDRNRYVRGASSKKTIRILSAERWAQAHHCPAKLVTVRCRKDDSYVGCRGTRWQRCRVERRGDNCSRRASQVADTPRS